MLRHYRRFINMRFLKRNLLIKTLGYSLLFKIISLKDNNELCFFNENLLFANVSLVGITLLLYTLQYTIGCQSF